MPGAPVKGQGSRQTRLYALMSDGRTVTSADVQGALALDRVSATHLLVAENGAGTIRRVQNGVYVKNDNGGDESYPDSFRIIIPKLMHEKGMTFRSLAAVAGVHFSHLCNTSSGRRGMSQEGMASVAGALGIKPEAIREYRIAQVMERLRTDPDMERRVYKMTLRSGKSSPRGVEPA